MQIDLTQLPEGLTHIETELEAPSIGLTREELEVKGPMMVGLDLDRRGDEIWIRGQVQLVAVQQCSRCLTDFSETLELDFDVFCAKVRNPHTASAKAVEEEDEGVHFHDGRVLSIDQEIREAVILGLPMKPLCKDSCEGLCPRCGEDRNFGPCRCARVASG
jgi:uncharacterized protein